MEDRERQGFFHFIDFEVEGGGKFSIATTRPELLVSCAAVVAHPSDKRFKKLFGKKAITPLFKKKVPIFSSSHADPEKGTGILMVCAYGDKEDVDFIHKKKLNVETVIDDQGMFKSLETYKEHLQSENMEEASQIYSEIQGLRVKVAREKIVEILKQKKLLSKESEPCIQNVKFYEKGDFPLEILPKRQWYVKVLDHKKELLKQGKKVNWYPSSMRKRYEQWVEGLNQDWCISRQRFYGVPFPIWYKIDKEGSKDYSQILTPFGECSLKDIKKFKNKAGDLLPVDPLKETPLGFKEEDRGKPGGFFAETDVLDTWATSSLSPQINSSWILDEKSHKKLFPASLRPQAHEIIRTWAFYTIVKSYFHEKSIPWKNIVVSGLVINKDKEKLSKSKGGFLDPEKLLEEHSVDAIRYWTAKGRLGSDTVYDENLFKIGRRLCAKIFNAARFVGLQTEGLKTQNLKESLSEITESVDKCWMKKMLETYKEAGDLLKENNFTQGLELVEKNFWNFCDNFLELIKGRVYKLKGEKEALSGARALDCSMDIFLKLFAPYLPYVSEEVFSLRSKESLHKTLWLKEAEIKSLMSKISFKEDFLEEVFLILEKVRSLKTKSQKSLASPLKSLKVKVPKDLLKKGDLFKKDLIFASQVEEENLSLEEGKELSVELEFKEEEK